MIIRFFNIEWDVTDENGNDCDGRYYNLPNEIFIVDANQELIDAAKATLEMNEATDGLEDFLSDEYEFCVAGFGLELYESEYDFEADDNYLETKWDELADVLFDEDGYGELLLADYWFLFSKGTSREVIWD